MYLAFFKVPDHIISSSFLTIISNRRKNLDSEGEFIGMLLNSYVAWMCVWCNVICYVCALIVSVLDSFMILLIRENEQFFDRIFYVISSFSHVVLYFQRRIP